MVSVNASYVKDPELKFIPGQVKNDLAIVKVTITKQSIEKYTVIFVTLY